MTENQLKKLGFELVKQYEHDQFNTNRYSKGYLLVEFTYENGELVSCDLVVEETDALPVTLELMKAITPHLGQLKQ